MPPIAFLALLSMAMLLLAVLRLELNFRRVAEAGPDIDPESGVPQAPGREPQRAGPRPELRAPPAGGYWQAPYSRPQARRAGFAL
ncbi:MAG TPA: hypothetical protein VF548_03925 [Allosphingosinicella sp.]|jgi:hypothetical protein